MIKKIQSVITAAEMKFLRRLVDKRRMGIERNEKIQETFKLELLVEAMGRTQ